MFEIVIRIFISALLSSNTNFVNNEALKAGEVVSLKNQQQRLVKLNEDNVDNTDENKPKVSAEPQLSNNSSQSELPVSISIPAISLYSKIESLGKDELGLQKVPSEGKTVGWFNLGPKPGETGSAVIAGHYDVGGIPTVFYNLSKVKKGDTIKIKDSNGKESTFKVFQTEIVSLNEFSVSKVYKNNSGKFLNLVTCHGKYLLNEDNYSQRFIAYAETSN
jgi:sortase A